MDKIPEVQMGRFTWHTEAPVFSENGPPRPSTWFSHAGLAEQERVKNMSPVFFSSEVLLNSKMFTF